MKLAAVRHNVQKHPDKEVHLKHSLWAGEIKHGTFYSHLPRSPGPLVSISWCSLEEYCILRGAHFSD